MCVWEEDIANSSLSWPALPFLLLCPNFVRSLQAAEQDQLRGEGQREKSAEGKRGREPFVLSRIHSPFSLLSLPYKWHPFSLIGLSYHDSTIFADCSLPLS